MVVTLAGPVKDAVAEGGPQLIEVLVASGHGSLQKRPVGTGSRSRASQRS